MTRYLTRLLKQSTALSGQTRGTVVSAGRTVARSMLAISASGGIMLLASGGEAYSQATMDNTFSVQGTAPDASPVSDSVIEQVDLIDAAPAVTVEKTSATTTVNDDGVTINYTISVDNTGNVSLTNINITDTLTQDGTDTALTLTGPTGDSDSDGQIDPDETWEYTTSYVTTQTNIDNGNDLVNRVDVTFDETGTTVHTDDHTVTIDQNNDINVTKTADVASVAASGDTITYSILVENNGATTATAITLTDPLGPVVCPTSTTNTIATLNPGASETCTITYTVLQADLDLQGANDGGPDGADGDIDNTVTVSGTVGGAPFTETDDEAVTLTINPGLTILKEADTTGPVNADDVITYTFTVTNSGNVTITDVSVNEDAFNGSGGPLTPGSETLLTDNGTAGDSTDTNPTAGIWGTLAPGDVITFTATYTVTQDDVDNLQ